MGLLRVTMRGYVGTNACFQVYVVETPGTEYDGAAQVVEYLANAYFDHLQPFVSTAYTLVDAYVQPLIPGGLPGVSVVGGPMPFAGTNAAELLPQQAAGLISFSALAPHPNRARKFIGALTEASWEGGSWGASTMAGFTAFATELVDMPTLLGADYNYRAWRAGPLGTWTLGAILTEFKVNSYAVVQRRRRPGVGI